MGARKFIPVCYLLAWLVAVNGVVNIMSAWFIHHPARLTTLRHYLPLVVIRGSWLTGVLAGSAQLFLAWSLARRKKMAWLVTLLVLVLSTVTQLINGRHYLQVAINLVLLVSLLALQPCFTAASDPPSVRRGVLAFPAITFFTLVYGSAGFYLLDRYFHRQFNLIDSVRQAVSFLLRLDTPELARPALPARWFLDSLAIIQYGGLFYSFLAILRPVVYRRITVPAEREKARAIVNRHGRSSLAHLTLLDDKDYFFSRSGLSFVAYTLVGNVAVALGDPIGPDEDIADLISRFKEVCEKNDWHPVFYQVLPDFLALYQEAGLKSMKIGEEAVVELAGFSLAGGSRKSLRQSAGRAERRGYTTELLPPPQSEETISRLKEVSDHWLKHQQGGEKRFSLGWFDPDYLRQCPIMVVKDGNGTIQAFANLIPEYRRNEGTIDLMRRREDDGGLMDLLFVRLIEYFREQRYDTFNLGLCPLAGVGEDRDAGVQEKVARLFYRHFNQLYSFKGLRQFKEKFGPRWEPRYLIYGSSLALPKIALAIVTANAGGSLRSYLESRREKKRLA